VQDQITHIDQVPVEEEHPHRFGHVAARLPTGSQAGGFQSGIEAQDADRDLFQPSGDLLPRQLWQSIGAGRQPLLVEVPCPAPEIVSGAFWRAKPQAIRATRIASGGIFGCSPFSPSRSPR
jgi:hypothetical protein